MDEDRNDTMALHILHDLSDILTPLYLKIFVPCAILLMSYLLLAYCANMIAGRPGETLHASIRFRRSVATILPFLLSLYTVLVSELYRFPTLSEVPFILFFLGGFALGFLFTMWISQIDPANEMFTTLSCFVSSMIFFTVITVFVITQSFQIVSFIFGFLIGICVFIVAYGFSHLHTFKFPMQAVGSLLNGARQLLLKLKSRFKQRQEAR